MGNMRTSRGITAVIPAAWVEGIFYYPGALRLHNEDWWRVRAGQGHTSSLTNAPGTEGGATIWENMLDVIGIGGTPGSVAVWDGSKWVVGIDLDPQVASIMAARALLQQSALVTSEETGEQGEFDETGVFLSRPGQAPEDPPETLHAQFDALAGLAASGATATDHVLRKSVAALAHTPQCRLWVPPNYIQPTGDAAVALTSANHAVGVRFTPDIDVDLAGQYLSLYITANATPGLLTIELRDHVAATDTWGALLHSYGTKDTTGVNADTWSSLLLDAYQLQRDKAYWLVVSGEAEKSISLSVRRWNVAQGSMFPDGCICKTTTDGGTTQTEATQDSRPAMLNFVLGATAHHSPQAVLGRRNGPFIQMRSAGGTWGLEELPDDGLWLNCEALPANTGHNIYVDSNGLSAATTARVIQDGVEVNSGDLTKRFLGGMYAIERQTGYQAPIDVADYRGVDVCDEITHKILAKRNPYAAVTTFTPGVNYTWYRWGDSDNWKVFAYVCKRRRVNMISFAPYSNGYMSFAIGGDAATPHVFSTSSYYYSATMMGFAQLNADFEPGLHYFLPLINRNDQTNPTLREWLSLDWKSSFYGEIA